MDKSSEFQEVLEKVDRTELVETLSAAMRGEASNADERRLVLEFLHRKRFINLELSRPYYAAKGLPEIEVVGATLTAAGGQLLDWLTPEQRSEAANAGQ